MLAPFTRRVLGTTVRAADDGQVLGVDISAPLLRRAEQHARQGPGSSPPATPVSEKEPRGDQPAGDNSSGAPVRSPPRHRGHLAGWATPYRPRQDPGGGRDAAPGRPGRSRPSAK